MFSFWCFHVPNIARRLTFLMITQLLLLFVYLTHFSISFDWKDDFSVFWCLDIRFYCFGCGIVVISRVEHFGSHENFINWSSHQQKCCFSLLCVPWQLNLLRQNHYEPFSRVENFWFLTMFSLWFTSHVIVFINTFTLVEKTTTNYDYNNWSIFTQSSNWNHNIFTL